MRDLKNLKNWTRLIHLPRKPATGLILGPLKVTAAPLWSPFVKGGGKGGM